MHTLTSSHGLKRSWYSCPRQVNDCITQHAPSMKTECDYLYGWIKNWSHTQKSHPNMVNPRDLAGKAEEEEEEELLTKHNHHTHTSRQDRYHCKQNITIILMLIDRTGTTVNKNNHHTHSVRQDRSHCKQKHNRHTHTNRQKRYHCNKTKPSYSH